MCRTTEFVVHIRLYKEARLMHLKSSMDTIYSNIQGGTLKRLIFKIDCHSRNYDTKSH